MVRVWTSAECELAPLVVSGLEFHQLTEKWSAVAECHREKRFWLAIHGNVYDVS
jgi:cytochrome b involved in lipid metabolism